MCDDIDDLLDEVEEQFVKKPVNKLNTSYTPIQGTTIQKKKSHLNDDLNTLMDEICDIPDPEPVQKVSTPVIPETSMDTKRRCFTVYLGGSAIPEGITTTASQKACDKLRCTDCDFKISVYKDFRWDSSIDYLFLRNNMPDFSRLKSKLTSKPGSKAYACQCKWKNINKLTELGAERDLKWVCGKH